MILLRDENPTLHASLATFLIIGVNAAAWIFVQGLGFDKPLIESICKFGLISGELMGQISPGTQVPLGPNFACVLDGDSNWITPITSMFMHGGWLHLIGNMWFLAIFGDNVEDAMGSVRFVLFYLLCGLSAAAAQMVSDPSSVIPMVGASGAIGGVMGAYAVLYPRAPVHLLVFLGFYITRVIVPAIFMLGYWFLLQVLSGMAAYSGSGGVAFWAHVGGFVAGVVLVRLFCHSERLALCRNKRGRTRRIMRRHR
jgi:membrane associated rhomboid family serine protease